ncbi:MAG: hypothetical protein ACR2GR_01770 [Rhodothermales bacterium]
MLLASSAWLGCGSERAEDRPPPISAASGDELPREATSTPFQKECLKLREEAFIEAPTRFAVSSGLLIDPKLKKMMPTFYDEHLRRPLTRTHDWGQYYSFDPADYIYRYSELDLSTYAIEVDAEGDCLVTVLVSVEFNGGTTEIHRFRFDSQGHLKSQIRLAAKSDLAECSFRAHSSFTDSATLERFEIQECAVDDASGECCVTGVDSVRTVLRWTRPGSHIVADRDSLHFTRPVL